MPFQLFHYEHVAKEINLLSCIRTIMNNSTFRYSGAKSGEKWTTALYWFVSNLYEIEKCWFRKGGKKKSKEKEQSLQCPKPVFCFTGKSQHHEAHSHPHQTALFPSAQKALGVVKRHIAALEKGTKNEIKQEVILDKTCFLKRLIFLSCISKYVFISCFVIKHFLRSTKDYTVNKKKKKKCVLRGADSLPEICLSRFMGLKLCWGKTS